MGWRSIAAADDRGKRRTLSDLTNEEGDAHRPADPLSQPALALAAAARKPVVRTNDQSIVKELTALRRTLIISLFELKSRKARMRAAAAAKTIATRIAANLRAIKTIEAAIRQAIKDNPDARHKAGQILDLLHNLLLTTV